MDTQALEQEIGEALRVHERWRLKLRSAITSGKLPVPAAEVGRGDLCDFGKRLAELEARGDVAGQGRVRSVMQAHAAFHEEAGKIAALIDAGNMPAASDRLAGARYDAVAGALTRELTAWRADLRGAAAQGGGTGGKTPGQEEADSYWAERMRRRRASLQPGRGS